MKRKQISGVIVKDFSRFSRDHIEQGKYIEQIFPVSYTHLGDEGLKRPAYTLIGTTGRVVRTEIKRLQ